MRKRMMGLMGSLGLMALLATPLALTGCLSTNITELTKSLAQDPAAVKVLVQTPYGSITVTRVGSMPNETRAIAADGTITITQGALVSGSTAIVPATTGTMGALAPAATAPPAAPAFSAAPPASPPAANALPATTVTTPAPATVPVPASPPAAAVPVPAPK